MYIIDEKCIACSRCAIECPTGAIAEGEDIFIPKELYKVAGYLKNPIEEPNRYIIHHELCNDCGLCAEVCPVDAIVEIHK